MSNNEVTVQEVRALLMEVEKKEVAQRQAEQLAREWQIGTWREFDSLRGTPYLRISADRIVYFGTDGTMLSAYSDGNWMQGNPAKVRIVYEGRL